jgi:two-component system nitrate/nitrite response regulator NarL
MKPLKIYIADDHQLVLEGLTSLINGIPDFELTGKFFSGEDLLSALNSTIELPNLCILDIEMPGLGGVEVLAIIKEKFPAIKVLILTMHEEPFYINRMIKEGADGYLLKNLNRDTFIQCILKIKNNESFFVEGFPPKSALSNAHDKSEDILTVREKLILKLIAQGKSNKEIAAELFISKRTVDTHRNNLKRKLGLASTVHLVHYSYANGLV